MSEVDDILREQLEAARALLAILNREYEAIRSRDAKALSIITPEKLEGTKSLEALDEKRRALDLAQAPADSLTKSANSSSENSSVFAQIIDVVRLCDRKNQLNGVMLELRKEQIHRALELIAGANNETTTYTASGIKKANVVYGSTSLSA